MSKKLVMTVMSAALVAIWTSPAFAVSVTFDLTGGAGYVGPGSQPFSVTSGSHSVGVRGYSHPGGASANVPFASLTAEGLHQNSDGLGVRSSLGDSNQLDAIGTDETMFLDFSSFSNQVQLESVTFTWASNGDEFDLGVDNVDVGINGIFGSDEIESIGAPGGPGGLTLDYVVDFTVASIVGTVFQFYTDDNNDGYKIASVTVSEVPEPATMGLLGIAALSGLGLRRRKMLGV